MMTLRVASVAWPLALLAALVPSAMAADSQPGAQAFLGGLPDADGRFDIGNVPAGSYSVKAWHPTLGEQTRAVTVPASGAVSVSFDF